MEDKISEYIKNLEEELKKIGIKITINEGFRVSATGGSNVLNPEKVDRATILAAKLEGFKDAVRFFETSKEKEKN